MLLEVIKYAGQTIGVTIVSNLIFRAFNSVSDPAKVTFLNICSYAYGKKIECSPSIARMANDRDVTRKTIIEHIKELKRKKLLISKSSPGIRNTYRLPDLNDFKNEIEEYIKKQYSGKQLSEIIKLIKKDDIPIKKCDIPDLISAARLKSNSLLYLWCKGDSKHKGICDHFCPDKNKTVCMAWFDDFKKEVIYHIIRNDICQIEKIKVFQKTSKYYQIFKNQFYQWKEKERAGIATLFRQWRDSR